MGEEKMYIEISIETIKDLVELINLAQGSDFTRDLNETQARKILKQDFYEIEDESSVKVIEDPHADGILIMFDDKVIKVDDSDVVPEVEIRQSSKDETLIIGFDGCTIYREIEKHN